MIHCHYNSLYEPHFILLTRSISPEGEAVPSTLPSERMELGKGRQCPITLFMYVRKYL